jgi:hypothetical protein
MSTLAGTCIIAGIVIVIGFVLAYIAKKQDK